MPTKQHYLRIDTGEFEGVYELKKLVELPVIKDVIVCPCCKEAITPVMDVIQWGFWQDEYTSYFVCRPCQRAYTYSYTLVCTVTEVKSDSAS